MYNISELVEQSAEITISVKDEVAEFLQTSVFIDPVISIEYTPESFAEFVYQLTVFNYDSNFIKELLCPGVVGVTKIE